MWLTKSYSFIKTRIDYHMKKRSAIEQEPLQQQVQKQRSQSANSRIKINVIKDYYKCSKDDQHSYGSIEINDITFIEDATKFKILEKADWQLILKNKSFQGFNQQYIHQSILLQTIDFDIRRQWWIFISNQEANKKLLQNKPFRKLIKMNTIHQTQIEKDVQRTIIHDMFKQNDNLLALRNILIAYANYDTELGYVQGLNIIVANLLICYDMSVNDQQLSDFEVMDDSRDETVFYLLLYIMKDLSWRTIFLEGLEGLRIRIDFLEQLMKKKIPDLHKHFYNEGITDFFPFFSRFYMTLIMYNIPWRFTSMILDLFLYEGEEIIHKLLLAMLIYHKNKLLKRNQIEIRQFCTEQMVREFLELFDAPQPNLLGILQKLNLS